MRGRDSSTCGGRGGWGRAGQHHRDVAGSSGLCSRCGPPYQVVARGDVVQQSVVRQETTPSHRHADGRRGHRAFEIRHDAVGRHASGGALAGGLDSAGSFSNKAALIGAGGPRVVVTAIAKHEPIFASKISAPGQRPSLSLMIEDGNKAVTIRVDDVLGVAGFVQPDDRVDVLLTRADRRTAAGTGVEPTPTCCCRIRACSPSTNSPIAIRRPSRSRP